MDALQRTNRVGCPRHNFKYTPSGVVQVIGTGIERIIASSKLLPRNEKALEASFNSSVAPDIAVLAYLERLCKYTRCSANTLVCALIYVDRMVVIHKVKLTYRNAHRIVLACLVAAIKYSDDHFCSNAYYARVGGVSLRELNRLEVALLSMLDFDLYVDEEHFKLYRAEVFRTAMQLDHRTEAMPRRRHEPEPEHQCAS
eukprot:TRINITY_DN158_c0_g2_i3.p1 TRINITY_DN158_c0_g2~~TRINITY_DN158_c0_g2_i3.p1  ORF type:complete len:199 (-),score=73.81 TRINITY_DN158_c0_g2_i3:195-791(-)